MNDKIKIEVTKEQIKIINDIANKLNYKKRMLDEDKKKAFNDRMLLNYRKRRIKQGYILRDSNKIIKNK